MKHMYTQSYEDTEVIIECACNTCTSSLLIDYNTLRIRCADCLHEESFPAYAVDFPETLVKEYYSDPLADYVFTNRETRRLKLIEETMKLSFWNKINA